MATTPVKWSHFNDPSRDRTAPTAEQKNQIINQIIEASSAAGLSKHDTAHVLALVNFESGFNPNAANPDSSASGLGQFIDSTGEKFGLREDNRWKVEKQINAVIEHFQENKALAEKSNLGEAGIYGAHHDGAAGVLKANAPGLSLAEKHVIPKISQFEQLIDQKISSGEVAFNGIETTHKPADAGHWEDTTQYDALGNVTMPGERYWVSDTPPTEKSSNAQTVVNSAQQAPSGPTTSPRSSSSAGTPTDRANASEPLPTGDAFDAPLPDGTTVVSISQTVNGQTTITAELHSAQGHVLLRAEPGQTMVRDPETGMVQVRTGTSDLVQQYDPATGEVTHALRSDSDAARVYGALLDAFSQPAASVGPGVLVADAGGGLPETNAMAANTESPTTLPLILRHELIPVMRYGNFAGPGYAGQLGAESTITDPAIHQGKPTLVADLVKTPQGLAQFMAVATQTEPNGYLDAVTRNHDVEYTVAEVRYMNKVQAQFDGKLPHELSAQDKASPAYQNLQAERNQEYWAADQRMLQAAVAYQPTDFVDSTYRDLMVKGFYVKASEGLGGEYGIPKAELNGFFDTLKAQDPSLGTPETFGQKVSALTQAMQLARSDFESLSTLPITPQERAFFNPHLQAGSTIVPSDVDANGQTIPWDQRNFSHSVVVPFETAQGSNIYVARVMVDGKEITSYLDKNNKDHAVFTQEIRVNGVLVSSETRTPIDDGVPIRSGENTARAYHVEVRSGSGELQSSYTLDKPNVPKLKIDDDLQAKLQAVQSGDYSSVVAEIQTNPFSREAVNGADLQSDQAGSTASEPTDNNTPSTEDALIDAFNKADQTATDLKAQYPGVQVADASGALPEAPLASLDPNPHSFSAYLDTQGANLTPAQQTALASQLDALGLGGEADLSFYSLPGGGALIANADGDIVGELVHSSSGDLNLRGSAIDANGHAVDVNQHISESGSVQDQVQYNAATQQQAAAMFNSLMAAGQWDHLSDLGKLSALVNLYNATDHLGDAFEGTGNNLPGDLSAAAGWLSLAQGLESGDGLVIANAINTLSDHALDNALNEAFGSSAAGEAVPYLSYALAIRNFADNPAQAIFTAAGTYAGEAIGMAIGGPIGAAIGGAIGGMIGGALGGLFGDDDPPPPPEGVVHFSWDAQGHIQHTIDFNQSGGGDVANSVAASVQGLLEQVVTSINTQSLGTEGDVAINPYLLPKIGYSPGGAWIEVVLPDGSTMREGVNQDSFAQRLLEILQDNGAIAPAWQVHTEQLRWQHAQEQVQQLQAPRDALQETHTIEVEGGWLSQVGIAAGQEERYSALSAQIEQAQAQLTEMTQDFKLGAGGHAHAGNAAYSLQGNASESADFQTQSFGTLAVHLGSDPALQAAQNQLNTQLVQVLRDVEGDGYLEATESLAAKDSTGHLQALLTIDFNGDGIVQTRDILNLGGNKDDSANLTDQARLANQNAEQQRNNVQWLDANSDGVLDQRDPAFAAIRLWVDINQDGVQQAGEASTLAGQHIASIDFQAGTVTYEDGHRHGGGNVEGAPTETTATGATDLGAVKRQANVTTHSTVNEGDARVVEKNSEGQLIAASNDPIFTPVIRQTA